MCSKLVLFIGHMFEPNFTGKFCEKRDRYRCIFADSTILGLAAASVMQPDIVIYQLDTTLLPATYIKFQLKNMVTDGRFFVFFSQKDDNKVN